MSQHNTPLSKEMYPSYTFQGTHRQIGQGYGTSCSRKIKQHLEFALNNLTKEMKVSTKRKVEEAALKYQPYVKRYAPFLDEEIQGVAEGAGISLGAAYFLQLRAEIFQHFDPKEHECTTFAVSPEASKNARPIIGQNVDLDLVYNEFYVVIEKIPDEGPATLMLTLAGQVSFIGINNRGMGVFGNFLSCDGWREGFPRYMLSGLALSKATVNEASSSIEKVYRASSRNLIMIDQHGEAVNLEIIPESMGILRPMHGILAHSNHFVSKKLLSQEKKINEDLRNSKVRLMRMQALLESNCGDIDVEVMQNILRDRTTVPHTLCRMKGDFGIGTTSASVIAEPCQGKLWIAKGPPNQYEYKLYEFSSKNQ